MEDCSRKKMKKIPTPNEMKSLILNTKEPLVIKNMLSWNLCNWSSDDWIENLGNRDIDLRIGNKQCTKMPQWEKNCTIITASLKDVLDDDRDKSSSNWMYFDYKHMKNCFKNNSEFLESLSWADFGFPEKNGKDSTIWIGTQGAYTPCHIDSYGCNIIAQVYGRKQWVMLPPSKSSVLNPTRVPYEESTIYSHVHFACGLNITDNIEGACVVDLCPGDVLIVPRHWWHYVENLTTAISINMWIPLKSDDNSRLEESLVRFFVHMVLRTTDNNKETSVLNPNETDLLDEPLDLQQISLCVERCIKNSCPISSGEYSYGSTELSSFVTTLPVMTAEDLQSVLLKKCGCLKKLNNSLKTPTLPVSSERIINAFCHPEVIATVAKILTNTSQ